MTLQRIDSPDDPRLADYRLTRDADRLRARGVFIAEGRFVVRELLAGRCRYRARSVLLTEPAMESLADVLAPIDARASSHTADLPEVFLASQAAMNVIAGFDIHRGCLALGEVGPPMSVAQLLESLPPAPTPLALCVLDDLTNHDNVGGIFRNAAALGCSAVILSERCCDPLYRKSIRVSMAAALKVPFARVKPHRSDEHHNQPPSPSGGGQGRGTPSTQPPTISTSANKHQSPWQHLAQRFREHHITPLALALTSDARDVTTAAPLLRGRVAFLLGQEGPGLCEHAIAAAGAVLRIPMTAGPMAIDSLNVSVAAAIALHEWRRANPGAV